MKFSNLILHKKEEKNSFFENRKNFLFKQKFLKKKMKKISEFFLSKKDKIENLFNIF